jgi:hypothetical protein
MSRKRMPTALEWAASVPLESAAERALMVAIAQRANEASGQAQDRRTTLGRLACMSKATVWRTAQKLAEKGRGLLALTTLKTDSGDYDETIYTLIGWLALRGVGAPETREGVIDLRKRSDQIEQTPRGSQGVINLRIGCDQIDQTVASDRADGVRNLTTGGCDQSDHVESNTSPPEKVAYAVAGASAWSDVELLDRAAAHFPGQIENASPAVHTAVELRRLLAPMSGAACTWADLEAAMIEKAVQLSNRGEKLRSWEWIREGALKHRDRRLQGLPEPKRKTPPLRGFNDGRQGPATARERATENMDAGLLAALAQRRGQDAGDASELDADCGPAALAAPAGSIRNAG